MGLGLLAGVGALVDYWPADVRLPRTVSVSLRPSLARAYAVPESTPVVEFAAEPARRVAIAASVSTPVVGLERVSANLSDDLAAPAESLFDVVPAVATSAPAQRVALSLPRPASRTTPASPNPAAVLLGRSRRTVLFSRMR
jgi:hypothetical protein